MESINSGFITVRNHYAFASVFTEDMELTRKFISALIGKEISKVQLAEKERVFEGSLDGKSIRYDVYLKDEEGGSFDLELQISNDRNLAKRVRYYHSILTADALLKGQFYDKLKDCYVIFIFTDIDPLGKGKTVYEIGNTILNEDNELFEDGQHTFIFNFSKNREKTEDGAIEEIADYFYNNHVSGELSGRIDEMVQELNSNPTWRRKIMTYEQELEAQKRISREEGLEEGYSKAKSDMAMAMLQKGIDIAIVTEITGLSEEELNKLTRNK